MKHDPIYPNEPGHRGIDTSVEAAEAMSPVTGPLRRMAYDAILRAGARGLTTNELADLLNIDRGSVQPRTSELKLLRRIADSGDRRRNANGKRAIVWIAISQAERASPQLAFHEGRRAPARQTS